MDNKSTKPLKEGKSVRIPPKRGQIKVKIFIKIENITVQYQK